MSNSTPNWGLNYDPPPAEWNLWWSKKQDWSAVLDQLVAQGGTITINGGTIAGSVTFTGAGTALTVNNNASIGGTLGVTGASTFSTATITSNATVGGTFGVTGNTTLSSALSVTGAATLSSTLGVTGAATLSSTLGVTGNTTVGGTLGVTGATTVNNLTVNGTFTGPALTVVVTDYLAGMILSNDVGTPNSVIDVSAGVATDSTNVTSITLGAFTKSTAGSFAAGSGSNGMGQGLTVAINTWYHVFAVIVSGTADVYFDTSITAANKPASTTAFRRIGSFRTDASAHIIKFTQDGDQFVWFAPVGDVSVANLGGTATLFTLTVPTGLNVRALFNASGGNAGAWQILFSDPTLQSNASATPLGNTSMSNAAGASASGQFAIRTNTSAQINAVGSAASTTLQLATTGWIDTRGRTFG